MNDLTDDLEAEGHATTTGQWIAIHNRTERVLADVRLERSSIRKHRGDFEGLRDGTGDTDVHELTAMLGTSWVELRDVVTTIARNNAARDVLTYTDLALEEILTVFADDVPERTRDDLVRTIAVLVEWVEAIDRRTPASGITVREEPQRG